MYKIWHPSTIVNCFAIDARDIAIFLNETDPNFLLQSSFHRLLVYSHMSLGFSWDYLTHDETLYEERRKYGDYYDEFVSLSIVELAMFDNRFNSIEVQKFLLQQLQLIHQELQSLATAKDPSICIPIPVLPSLAHEKFDDDVSDLFF